MLSLFRVPVPNGPAGAGAGPAFGAGPRSGWPGWSYEGAHEAITLGERHRSKRGVLSAPPGRGAWKAFPSRGGSRRSLPPNCPAHSGRGGEVEGRLSSALFRPVPESRGRHLAPWQRRGRKRRGKTRALQAEPRSGTGWGREPTGGSRAGLFCRVGDHFDDSVSLVSRAIGVDRSLEALRALWPKAEKGPRLLFPGPQGIVWVKGWFSRWGGFLASPSRLKRQAQGQNGTWEASA
jgi:hypothetical protein